MQGTKKFLAVLLALAMVIGSNSLILVGNAAYENSYINTGNQRADIIGVAKTQIGYTEGSNNDTKYGTWYGLPNQPWCAMFVSWCARQADIPTSILKNSAGAGTSSSYFNIPYYDGASYTPKQGDLFFTKSWSHVGLVWYTDGSYFYTIEGNSNSNGSSEGVAVVSNRRLISNFYFGVPDYEDNSRTLVDVPEGVYVFHCVRNPDRVLDIQGDSTERGANIQLYNNWYNQVQKFRVVNMGDYYCIQSVYSGKWLDISYPYNEQGCNIQLWDTNTSTEQKWVFEDAGNGNVYIRSLYGMYLDTGGPTDNNTNIQTWPFDGSTSQQWKLELTSPYGRKDVADGIYTFHNYRNQNRVLDIMYDSTEIRANIQLYDDLNNSVQRFRVTKVLDDTNSFYYVIQSVYSGYWLDIASPFTTSGCNVQLWQDHSSPEQKWVFEDAGNGKVLIRSLCGTYVDLENGKTDNSTNVQTFNYDGSTSMEWVMHRVYTVTYNANGGSGAPSEQAKQSDISIKLSSTKPSRSGYTFNGWNTKADGSGTNYASGATYTGNADVTLYAKWTANTYTVNINANGGTATTSSLSVNYDTLCNLSPDYVQREGYELVGWNLYRPADGKWFVGGVGWCTASEISANGYQKAQYVPNLSMTLESSWLTGSSGSVSSFTFYAVWEANTYTVQFNGNGATSGSMSNQTFTYDVAQNLTTNAFVRKYTVTYNYNGATGGNSASTATATATFNGWATSASGAKVYDNMQSVKNLATSGTYNLYANWTPGTVILPTPTKTGFAFSGWNTQADGSGTNYNGGASFEPAAATTLYAQWTVNAYTVTLDPNGGECGIPAITAYYDEPYGVLPAATRDGFTFDGWFFGGTIVTENTVCITADNHTLTAHWTAVETPAAITAKADSAAVVDRERGFIYGLDFGLTETMLRTQYLDVSGGSLQIESETGAIGTGTVVRLIDDKTGDVVESFTVVLFGDVTGDGLLNSTDVTELRNINAHLTAYEDGSAFLFAADITHDGIVNSSDVTDIRSANARILDIGQTI